MTAVLPGEQEPERNRPEVEAAFAAMPAGMVAEILDGELFTWMLRETYEDDTRVRAEPFDAVELDLGAIWAR
jgi:hypothetical protein